MVTYFVVISFSVGKKGAWIADQPTEVPSKRHALSMAERLSHAKSGVLAFSRTIDPSTGDCSEADILFRSGEFPDEAIEALAA